MKNIAKYIIAVLAAGLFSAGAASAQATSGSGITTSKTVNKNADGSYTLTLEAFSTGKTVTTVVELAQSMDIALVIDVRGASNGGWGDLPNILASARKFVENVQAKDNVVNGVGEQRLSISIAKPDGALFKFTGFSGNYDEVYNAIATATDDARRSTSDKIKVFSDVNNLFSNYSTDSQRGKLVVYIGLGHIESNKWGNKDPKATEDLINSAGLQNLKKIASVWTIAMDSEDGPTKAMRLISSDFQGTLSSFDKAQFTNSTYGLSAGSINDLDNAFVTIQKSITEGGSTSTLTEKNSSIRDYVTPQFSIARNGSPESIRVKTYSVDTSAPLNGEPVFKSTPDSNGPSLSASIGEPDSDGNTPVIIRGFSFLDHWVGKDNVSGWHGKKVVIEIDIVLNENAYNSGFLYTNTDNSGIYSGETGQMEAQFNPTGINFTAPSIVLPKAILHVVKTGLKKDESAIFDITSTKGQTFTAMATCDADGTAEAFIEVEWLTFSADEITAPGFDASKITEETLVDFTVSEQDWTWADSDSPSEQTSSVFVISGDKIKKHDFIFGYSDPRVSNPKAYDEKYKVL